ncbi:MAG TPA: hypothetical protein VG733_07440 [Chthoniobacteraceae bacterium]|nr:hypothetical protein [Chthoniobacteraceae bacterium]
MSIKNAFPLLRKLSLATVMLAVCVVLSSIAAMVTYLGCIFRDGWMIYPAVMLWLSALYWAGRAVAMLRKPRTEHLPRWWERPKVIAVVGVAIALSVLPWMPLTYYWGAPLLFRWGLWPFMRWRMEAIVKQVRQRNFTGDAAFTADALGDVDSWDRTRPNGPDVWAYRGDDGSLQVSIIEFNRGHFGMFGYAYADKPPSKIVYDWPEDDDGRVHLSFPGTMQATYPRERIDEHWWKVWDDEE